MKTKEVHADKRTKVQKANARKTLETWSRLGLLFCSERFQRGSSFDDRKLREIATGGNLERSE